MRTINDPRDDCRQTMDADDQFAEPLANDLRQLQQLEKCLIKIEFRNIISHYQLQTLQKYTINEIPLTPLHSVSPSSPPLQYMRKLMQVNHPLFLNTKILMQVITLILEAVISFWEILKVILPGMKTKHMSL